MRADFTVQIHQRDDFDKAEKALLLALAITCFKDANSCYPSFGYLVKATGGWRERALRNALRRLEQRGVVSVEHAYRNANVYTLHLDVRSAPDAEHNGTSSAPHADLGESSPAFHTASSASDTGSSASHDVQTGTTCRQSECEVCKGNMNEVRSASLDFSIGRSRSQLADGRSLGQKVDAILDCPSAELVMTRGQVDIDKLARVICQQDRKGVEPSPGTRAAVAKCVVARDSYPASRRVAQ